MLKLHYAYSKRSQLYEVKTIGVGSPYIECLTSYLIRLSEVHKFYPSSLLSYIVAPVLDKEFLINSAKRGGNRFYDGARTINTFEQNAIDMVTVLESLTGVQHLDQLTLMGLKEVIPSRYLLKYKRKLEALCPNPKCRREQAAIRQSQGYCYVCGDWLGQREYDFSEKQYEITQRDEWINKSIGELLQVAPYIVPPTIEELALMLEQYVTVLFQSDHRQFCKALGIHPMTLKAIMLRKKRISLQALLSLSLYTKIPLLKLLNLSYKSSNDQNSKIKYLMLIIGIFICLVVTFTASLWGNN